MPSCHHVKKKTFIEASCANNIHTGENRFLQLLLLRMLFMRSINSFLYVDT